MSLKVLHAVELSVALRALEGAAARWVKLQSGPLASISGLLITLLELLLALAVVPPQQAGQVECLATILAGVVVGEGVAEAAAGPHMDSINLWRGFWDGSWFCHLEDVWELLSQPGAGQRTVGVLALNIQHFWFPLLQHFGLRR